MSSDSRHDEKTAERITVPEREGQPSLTENPSSRYGPDDEILELRVSTGEPKDIETFDDYALLVGEGLSAVDIGDPEAPIEVGSLSSDALVNGYGAVVSGNHAFVTDLEDGLVVVDVADPTAPEREGGLAIDKPRKPAIDGETLYASSSEGVANFYAIDVADPSDPERLGTLHDDAFDRSFEIAAREDIAFVAGRKNECLVAVDVADPSSPSIVGEFEDSVLIEPYGVEVVDDIAYVTCSEDGDGLLTVDVSDSTSMSKLGYIETGHTVHPYGLLVEDGYATVASKDGAAVTTVDVSDPASMSEVGTYSTTGTMYDVELVNGFVFGACRSAGTMTVGGWVSD